MNVGNEVIENNFYEYFTRDNTIVKTEFPFELLDFINGVLTDSSPFTGVLKCINQDIIVPAVSVLRYIFFTVELNYFEIRGRWKVLVESFDDKIVVTNKRWERSAPEGFNFKWEVSFVLNKQCTELLNTSISVSNIEYTVEGVTDEEKGQLLELLKDLYRPKVK